MKTLFKKENLKNTILTLLYLAFGISFCVTPVKMFNYVESALCFILLAAGIVCVLIYSLMSTDDKIVKLLVYGVIGLVLGLCMMLVPRLFGVLLSIVIGYSGISMIISGLKLKKAGQKTWITDFVIGVVVTALSVTTIVLSGTNAGKGITSVFFGVILLINGIYSLVQIIIKLKKEKEDKKKSLVEESVNGEETVNIEEAEDVDESKEESEVKEEQPVEEVKEIKTKKVAKKTSQTKKKSAKKKTTSKK